MKKLTLLIAAIFVTTVCFAQRVSISITDFCYKIPNSEMIDTYGDMTIVGQLAIKGFVVTDVEQYSGVGAGGAIYRFRKVTLYQESTETTVIIDQGPCEIIFKSADNVRSFLTEAINMRYITPEDSYYIPVGEEAPFGITSLWQRGNSVVFSVSVP
jgi:hypothetical protein